MQHARRSTRIVLLTPALTAGFVSASLLLAGAGASQESAPAAQPAKDEAAAPVSAQPAQAPAASTPAEIAARIESTRETLEKWVESRRLLSEEKRDWVLAKDMLISRAEMLKGEVGEVDGRIVEAEKSVTDADRRSADLVARNDALKAASGELAAMAASLETRTKELVTRLPDPIREKLRPLTQRLPDDPAKSELALSTRFQNVVGIVNEVNKFSREITVTSEVRKLPDGSSAEVTTVYLGLAQGYYVGGGGRLAGIGGAGDNGWTWTPANEYAPQIAKVVAILKNEHPAEFVPVPLGVK
ncbi:MAG: DUF3450 family protein [bacterium]